MKMGSPEARLKNSLAMKAKWAEPGYRERVLSARPCGPRILDGLSKSERYRQKDLVAYRKRKAEYARTAEQRAKRNAYMVAYKEKNRDRTNELARESHERNKLKHVEYRRNKHLVQTYGITLEERDRLIALQHGRCLICAEEFASQRTTHIDHCHTTNTIRGVLCHRCNTKLGWYETYKATIHAYLKMPPD